jgi:hypothetical protein
MGDKISRLDGRGAGFLERFPFAFRKAAVETRQLAFSQVERDLRSLRLFDQHEGQAMDFTLSGVPSLPQVNRMRTGWSASRFQHSLNQ